MSENPLIVITGATASGKTAKAVALATAIGGEIISADSRQIYRSMDIGTGKDLGEYGSVPYHLIDIVDAGYKYNLYEYLRDYQTAHDQIVERGAQPILCGGTGLYVESVVKGIKLPNVPENSELRESLKGESLDSLTKLLGSYKTLHNITDVDSCKRAIRAIEIQDYYTKHPNLINDITPSPINAKIYGLSIDREQRRNKITKRLKARLQEGMVAEVQTILDSGVTADDLIYYGLEYKFVTRYLIGELKYSEMVEALEIAIHQFAKRQMTWFRGMERRGYPIEWLPYDIPNDEFVDVIIKNNNLK
ncbi:MAG: tRNA (adenosine(37)-N6)-dimethylallyltransferase MiaA [Bacteroidales bacterium]